MNNRIILFLLLFLSINVATAQTKRYQQSVRGGFTIAANSLMLGDGPIYINNSGGARASSYSDLILPAGSKIEKAILYVEGYVTDNTKRISSVKFKAPAAVAYTTLTTTSTGFIANPTTGTYTQFIIDVTARMNGFDSTLTPGGNATGIGRYCVADPAPFDNSSSNYGYGWSIFVVYSNTNSKYRNVTIADGCLNFGVGTSVQVDINGITVPAIGTVNAVVGLTGCWGEDGATLTDNVKLGRVGGTLTQLADPTTGATDNALNGTIGIGSQNNVTADGGPVIAGNYTGRKPYNGFAGGKTSFYYDADIFNAAGALPVSATPINVRFEQASGIGDALASGTYAISVDIAAAELTKSLSPTSIANGGVATYTFKVDNTKAGAINLTNIGFTDNLPSGLMIATPNCVVKTGGTGGVITAVTGTNTFTLSGLNLNAGQICTITLCVTNKPGQLNPDCSSNPPAFTNGFSNISGNTVNLANAVTDQCLIVSGDPTAGFFADTVCQGTATTFTDTSKALPGTTISTWDWDFGVTPTATSSAQSPTFIFPSAGVYNVRLIAIASDGQRDTVIQLVKVNALPAVTLNSPVSICPGDSSQLLAGGADTYLWSPAATLTNAGINNPKAFPTTTTTYNLKATLTATGCYKDTTLKVTVFTLPVAGITGSLSVCPNVNSTLTGTGGVSYSWPLGGQNTPSITINQTTATSYTVIATDANGCKDSHQVTVNMAAPITKGVFTVVPRACSAANGSIAVGTITGGVSPYTYSINSGTFQSGTTFGSLDSLNYKITVQDSKGCLMDSTLKVGITPSPTAITFTTVPSGCGAPSGGISVTGVTGGKAPYQYSSSGAVGSFQSSTSFSPLGSGSYQLTALDANGCAFGVTAAVGSSSGPSGLNELVTKDSCGRQNGTIVISSVIGGQTPFQYSKDGGTTFQAANTFTGLTGGNFSIAVKDAGNCVYTKVITVGVVTGVSSFVITPTSESCNAKNGTLTITQETGGTAPYKYSIDGITYQSANVFASLDSGNYTVTVKGADLCPLSQTGYVGYLPPITNVSEVITPATCGNSNGSVTFTITGGTTPFNITVDANPSTTNLTIAGLSPSAHAINMVDASGCSFAKSITVLDTPGPTGISTSLQPTACVANTGSVQVIGVAGGTSPFQYSLAGGAYTASNVFNNLAAGTYSLDVKDANGCVLNNAVTIQTVNSPTAIQTTLQHTTCTQNNGGITITGVTGGTSPYLYSINGGAFTPDTSYNSLINQTYFIDVQDANQCAYQTSVTLTDSPSPTGVLINTVPTSCGRSLGAINLGAVTGGTAPFNYSVAGSTFSANTAYNNLAGGNYSVIVRDANLCTYTGSATVADIAGPSNLTVVHADDTCSRNSGMIQVTNVTGPATPFQYKLDNGSLQSSPIFTAVPAKGTPYVVTVQDANGCTVSVNRLVGIVSGPSNPTVNLVQPHCAKSDGTITVNPASITGGTSPFVFSISPSGVLAGNTFSGLVQGNYNLTVSDKYGCSNSQAVILTDILGPQSTSPVVTQSTCGLANGAVTIAGAQGGTAPYTYSSDQLTYTSNNVFASLSAGSGQAFWVKDAAGCVLPILVNIPNAAGSTDIIADVLAENCQHGDGELGNVDAVGGTSPVSFLMNSSLVVAEMGAYTNLTRGSYVIEATDANGCKLSKTFEVPHIVAPTAIFSPDNYSGDAPFNVAFDNQSINGTTYLWDFGNGDTSIADNPFYVYQDTGTFIVTLTATRGKCSDVVSRVIVANPPINIYVPTTFSPNGDGINDFFEISTSNVERFEGEIYNRWGQKVGSISNLNPQWDGRFQGEDCPSTVYAVQVSYVDYFKKKHKLVGTVSIIR